MQGRVQRKADIYDRAIAIYRQGLAAPVPLIGNIKKPGAGSINGLGFLYLICVYYVIPEFLKYMAGILRNLGLE